MSKSERKQKHLVMEGDWGGQIYLTVPVQLVITPEESVSRLLQELDKIAWACNEGSGMGMYCVPSRQKDGVDGGMGGGKLFPDAVWLHGHFQHERGFQKAEVLKLIRDLLGLSPDVKIVMGAD